MSRGSRELASAIRELGGDENTAAAFYDIKVENRNADGSFQLEDGGTVRLSLDDKVVAGDRVLVVRLIDNSLLILGRL